MRDSGGVVKDVGEYLNHRNADPPLLQGATSRSNVARDVSGSVGSRVSVGGSQINHQDQKAGIRETGVCRRPRNELNWHVFV